MTARGNERSPIYRDDADRSRFLEVLAEVRERRTWRILTYCLLTNHYHLLVGTPQANLAKGMRQLNGVHAQAYNRRHRRVGHLFQGRYSARLVQTDRHLLAVVRYIVRNPERAGICARPEDWRWSSHRATLGLAPSGCADVDELLAYFEGGGSSAVASYRSWCEKADDDDVATGHPLAYGDEAFISDMLENVAPAAGIPGRYYRAPRLGLEELLAPADLAALATARAHGYSLREIGRHLGVHASTVSRRLQQAEAADATIGT